MRFYVRKAGDRLYPALNLHARLGSSGGGTRTWFGQLFRQATMPRGPLVGNRCAAIVLAKESTCVVLLAPDTVATLQASGSKATVTVIDGTPPVTGRF